MKYTRYIAVVLALLLVLQGSAPMAAYAATPYEGYVYNHKQNTVPSINGYEYVDSIDGSMEEYGTFKNPQDLFVAADDSIYIADTDNHRIVHLSPDLKLLRIYGDPDGAGKLNGPRGVYAAEDGTVYVADTNNERIAVFATDGKLVREYKSPDSKLMDAKFQFLPAKITLDKFGYMFIVVEGLTQGLLQLNTEGEFMGYFGANHVPFSFTRIITKLIATQEQRKQMALTRPPAFSDLFRDNQGFVYTTTVGIDTQQVKRLSAVGVDVLNAQEGAQGIYGDLHFQTTTKLSTDDEWRVTSETVMRTPVFVGVAVDERGFITALDQMTGKAFHYDQLGNLLFVFGGLGNQQGLMITPSSIDISSDGTILIADQTRNRIDRYRETYFGSLVHKASVLYSEGRYEEAQEPWMEVLNLNSNYMLAYTAIGKSLHKQEKYKEATEYLHTSRAYNEYSMSFLELRKNFIREHFIWFVIGVILIVFLLKILLDRLRLRKRKLQQNYYKVSLEETEVKRKPVLDFFHNVGQVLVHPIDFFYNLQEPGRAKRRDALIIIAAVIICRMLSLSISSFLFQRREAYEISFLTEGLSIIILWLTWSVANWAISTLQDGEGKFKEVLVGSAYALIPFIILSVPISLLSRFLSLQEMSVYVFLTGFMYLWIAFLLIMKVKILHDFTLYKLILILILSIISMLIMWFIVILVYGLMYQAYQFVLNIIQELSFRL